MLDKYLYWLELVEEWNKNTQSNYDINLFFGKTKLYIIEITCN